MCAFVRSFAYSECPLAGETERERREKRTDGKDRQGVENGVGQK